MVKTVDIRIYSNLRKVNSRVGILMLSKNSLQFGRHLQLKLKSLKVL